MSGKSPRLKKILALFNQKYNLYWFNYDKYFNTLWNYLNLLVYMKTTIWINTAAERDKGIHWGDSQNTDKSD